MSSSLFIPCTFKKILCIGITHFTYGDRNLYLIVTTTTDLTGVTTHRDCVCVCCCQSNINERLRTCAKINGAM